MRLRTRISTLVLCTLALAAPGAFAQEPAPSFREAAGLRVEAGRWGQGSIYRGADRVGTVGIFRSELERVVADSEEAVRHARRFQQERAAGRALVVLGVAVSTAVLAGYAQGDDFDLGGWESAAMMAGAGAASYGTYRLTLSNRALERALRAFDRDRGR